MKAFNIKLLEDDEGELFGSSSSPGFLDCLGQVVFCLIEEKQVIFAYVNNLFQAASVVWGLRQLQVAAVSVGKRLYSSMKSWRSGSGEIGWFCVGTFIACVCALDVGLASWCVAFGPQIMRGLRKLRPRVELHFL